MGIFNLFKKEKKTSAALEGILAQYQVQCNFSIEQQREWLGILNKTIPTIMLGGVPACADYYLTPRNLDAAGNMLVVVSRIAFHVAQMLAATNLEKALDTRSAENLIRTYSILGGYEKLLIEPHKTHFTKCRTYIHSVLCKLDLSSLTAKPKENKLFWAPSIYAGDPLTLPEPDYDIHVFPAVGSMIANGASIQADSPLPEQYHFATKGSGKPLHLRTIRNSQLNTEMVPLFTDPNLLLQIFTPNTRISIVDFQTARRFCLQDKHICSGIVINPGRDNQTFSISQLEQEV